MKTLWIELQKEKRSGVIASLPLVGVLGALYAFANFSIRKEALLALPLPPMDILLTQLYGMLTVLNLFGIVVAACLIYAMEFRGNAIKKLSTLPISLPEVYSVKFLILTILLMIALGLQHLALAWIGQAELPAGSFVLRELIQFMGYAFVTSLPVLACMLAVSSIFENMWVPLGIGVAGFLSGLALATEKSPLFLLHPFILMFRPAVTLKAAPDWAVAGAAICETLAFLLVGLWFAKAPEKRKGN